jgi:hypothetical protein
MAAPSIKDALSDVAKLLQKDTTLRDMDTADMPTLRSGPI